MSAEKDYDNMSAKELRAEADKQEQQEGSVPKLRGILAASLRIRAAGKDLAAMQRSDLVKVLQRAAEYSTDSALAVEFKCAAERISQPNAFMAAAVALSAVVLEGDAGQMRDDFVEMLHAKAVA